MAGNYIVIRCPVCAMPWDADEFGEGHSRTAECYRYRNCEVVRMARLDEDRRVIEVNLKEAERVRKEAKHAHD